MNKRPGEALDCVRTMSDEAPRLLILGAHPDDAEFHAGGLACHWRRHGGRVRFVSVTNGDAGHHVLHGPALAERRRAEAIAAGAMIGAEVEVWNKPDGHLEPTLAVRWDVVRQMRAFAPDLVLTHRTNDYHPDHRAVGALVRDACYLVTVPALAPEVPALRTEPVVAFLPDRFTRPYPLRADLVLDTEDYVDTVAQMLACHKSQVFEWLPWQRGFEAPPASRQARIAWLKEWYLMFLQERAVRYRDELRRRFGDSRGEQVTACEVFEVSEYAAPLDETRRQRLAQVLGLAAQ